MIRKEVIENLRAFDDQGRIEFDKLLLNSIIEKHSESAIKYTKLPLAIGLLRINSLTTFEGSGFDRYGYSNKRKLI